MPSLSLGSGRGVMHPRETARRAGMLAGLAFVALATSRARHPGQGDLFVAQAGHRPPSEAGARPEPQFGHMHQSSPRHCSVSIVGGLLRYCWGPAVMFPAVKAIIRSMDKNATLRLTPIEIRNLTGALKTAIVEYDLGDLDAAPIRRVLAKVLRERERLGID